MPDPAPLEPKEAKDPYGINTPMLPLSSPLPAPAPDTSSSADPAQPTGQTPDDGEANKDDPTGGKGSRFFTPTNPTMWILPSCDSC
ncbi:hypothetical protein LTR28_010404, partial [Elasticomyces elasticus]